MLKYEYMYIGKDVVSFVTVKVMDTIIRLKLKRSICLFLNTRKIYNSNKDPKYWYSLFCETIRFVMYADITLVTSREIG